MGMIVVKTTWDADAKVWVAGSEDVQGLVTEADSIDALLKKLPGIIQDLLEYDGGSEVEVPIELIANASSRVVVRHAA